jgi:clan AA aspartic protease (TIGR02281 family)
MKKNTLFTILVLLLVAAGSYGVLTIFQGKNNTFKSDSATQSAVILESLTASQTQLAPMLRGTSQRINTVADQSGYEQTLVDITHLLETNQFKPAVELLESRHSRLSSKQLEEFASLFLSTANRLWQSDNSYQATTLLTLYNNAFNGLESWILLSNIQQDNKQWQQAINSLLSASAIEYRPDKLSALMTNLVTVASQQRASLEQRNDELGIQQLYQMLYERHPSYARFQLELALSHLRMNDITSARSLLEPLQYDAEFGAIANNTLAQLVENSTRSPEAGSIKPPKPISEEVVVPLLRSGHSFFVNAAINEHPLRLLLDTGASITALSQATIKSLRLKPTGRTIRLNTANGTLQAKLYLAERIRLGSLLLQDLLVAEIEFEKNSQIHGLLGTDLLNHLDNRYNYIIDNQRSELIFKAK